METNCKISVIVPFYKVEDYFEKCLESIVNQTLKEIEIILIDDCGNDSSIEIAKRFAEKDSRIRIIINERNRGQGYSRNVGILEARGEYIAFVDSDDRIKPNMYEALYNRAKDTDADITKCQFEFVYKDRTVLYDYSWCYPNPHKIYTAVENPIEILGYQMASCWNALYKREFLLKNNIKFDEINKFEDMYFSWETNILAKGIAFLPQSFYLYHKINEKQDTASVKYWLKYIIINLCEIKKMIKDRPEFYDAFGEYTVQSFRHIKPMTNIIGKCRLNIKQREILKDLNSKHIKSMRFGTRLWRLIRYATD